MSHLSYTDLIAKYDIPGPRYTSYPSVPFWEKAPHEKQWILALREQLLSPANDGAALYIHIPFCQKLCSYCGCHKFITKDLSKGRPYVELLLREWENYLNHLEISPPLSEIHLGGGTPTFLQSAELVQLMEPFINKSNLSSEAELSIEVDPRTTSKEQLQVLFHLGFRRLSLGVQDFDARVQKAINRLQPFELVAQVNDVARAIGFTSINFDLIYGLPFQTPETMEVTVRKSLTLSPDRLAYYSYAHVPWMKASQRLYRDSDIPAGVAKRRLYEIGKALFEESGYSEIGMDHFSKTEDALAKALRSKALHRNFMGYTTKHLTPLIGLGVSSIGDAWTAFAQNEKSLEAYTHALSMGRLPIERGHLLSEEDLQIRKVILELMTKFQTTQKIQDLGLSAQGQRALHEMQEDGLVELNALNQIQVTDKGQPFIRNICMVFDKRLERAKPDRPLFSRTI